MVFENKKVASRGKDATTSISESVHASSTVGLGIATNIYMLVTILRNLRYR
jgi:hypothetical protein